MMEKVVFCFNRLMLAIMHFVLEEQNTASFNNEMALDLCAAHNKFHSDIMYS